MKGCQLERQLQELPDDAIRDSMSLFEALGDLYCKVNSFAKAVEYYKKQVRVWVFVRIMMIWSWY